MERVLAIPGLPPRLPDTHKGTYGRILIAAGSPGMGGAAILAARAALRAGSGLVTVAVPAELSGALAMGVPEATQLILPDPAGPDYRKCLLDALRGKLERFQALAVGPGLGVDASASFLVETLLQSFHGPQVVDADALNILAAEPAIALRRDVERVWTPHPGEFERLTGSRPVGEAERISLSRRFVAERGGVLVLKGHRTVITTAGYYSINESGNPGMATGGAGDVLTGIIASFLGQGLPPFAAACLGVHLHGRAGDWAAARLGEVSVIAGDIVESLPQAIREHQGARAEGQRQRSGPR
jgi:NAD(P)H-hydrate epimerase